MTLGLDTNKLLRRGYFHQSSYPPYQANKPVEIEKTISKLSIFNEKGQRQKKKQQNMLIISQIKNNSI
uniref:Uncharacterized protein n=1 Tax=Arundo donax TaxID=35708 RepID=A0A0A9EIL7_ARUDO